MVPAALGESRGRSFLLTAAIEGCRKLTEWMAEHHGALRHNGQLQTLRQIIAGVADVARTMHAAGPASPGFLSDAPDGAARCEGNEPRRSTFSTWAASAGNGACRRRWIVKDLGQLNYSASGVCASDRLRFLTAYLGRPAENERPPTRYAVVLGKSRAIARHTQKNGL